MGKRYKVGIFTKRGKMEKKEDYVPGRPTSIIYPKIREHDKEKIFREFGEYLRLHFNPDLSKLTEEKREELGELFVKGKIKIIGWGIGELENKKKPNLEEKLENKKKFSSNH